MYYRGCDAAVVVFDVKDRSSYVKAKQWVQTLAENTEGQAVKPVLVICGNKRDLLEVRSCKERSKAKRRAEKARLRDTKHCTSPIFPYETPLLPTLPPFLMSANNLPCDSLRSAQQPKSGYIERCVPREEVDEYAGTVGGVYFETSAMEARDVEAVFVKIAESLKVPEVESDDETLDLKDRRRGDAGGCC